MTKSHANKLGERLRALKSPDSVLLAELQEFRLAYGAPLQDAEARIRDALGIEVTSRLKTTNTIIEKLRRERTRLSEMQD
ncbi:MAG TPA: hypothetical protein VGR00_06365, partial [Thermoanaerobaculia bacterium]|nr:hypothetical protein [Thermoanaerobaculia bacterium]